MRAGDGNNDNRVNGTDYNIFRHSFGTSIGMPGYDARADFNGDDNVDSQDFNLLQAELRAPGRAALANRGKKHQAKSINATCAGGIDAFELSMSLVLVGVYMN